MVSELLADLGLTGRDIFDLEWCLAEGQGTLIANREGSMARGSKQCHFAKSCPRRGS